MQGVHDAVQDELNEVRKLDELINAKLAERSQLWDMVTHITPNMDGMPHGTDVTDKVGNIAAKLADLARETDALVDKYVDKRQRIITMLETLPAEEYGVMHRHYIQFISWNKIAREMNYSRMQVFRIKQKALRRLQSSYTMLHSDVL